MGTSSRFEKFLGNLNLTSSNLTDAQTKYDGVARKLHSHYYGTAFDGSTRRLIGSYGKGTAVRPPRDVDLLFIMPNAEYWRYDGYVGNGQSQMLQDVRAVIQERYSTTEKIRGDGQVVVVPFSDGHSVEVLPAWINKAGKYTIADTHSGGSWKIADHAAEISNVDGADRQYNGNVRNLIKMLKAWQAECNVPIKSLTLELRSINFLKSWSNADKGFVYYDWMARDFFSELIKNAGNYCVVPGAQQRCQYGSDWLSRAETAYGRAVKACQYEADKQDYNAAVEWRKIFGSQYEF